MSAYFVAAVNWLLGPDIEGEHSNDPDDKGGDTWYGLAHRWNRDMPWPPTVVSWRSVTIKPCGSGCGYWRRRGRTALSPGN